jgi:hypothetical protein
MKIVGLDLSTTCCGWAVTENKSILACGFVDISDMIEYAAKAELIITALKDQTFEKIMIEESLFGFAGGGTSQQVIIKLVKNKAVVGYILENHYKLKVESIHAQTARKKAFGIARIKGIKSKVFVKEQVEKLYDMKPWTILNKKGNEEKRMEDVRDAIVLSLAG